MEVILLEDVANLGEMGEIVEVAAGYGRNYLIPNAMAELASAARKNEINHRLAVVEARREKEREEARKIVGDIDGVSISVPSRIAEDDRLYGSVTARDIADVLAQQGITVDHKQIEIDAPIRELGIYKIPVKLASAIYAYVRLWVVAV
ncbi:50S ribosomal protein L9 [Bradymonas sediminis]|uniref:Large ribosomal subunit protein bL9 n=1 Tax=Bradymonas sediminis TaxID=1548548 RepID=A0A2Z4FM58_9DELT|nr:50S ribosomal protein L9 [Bradymonas sediminis]AWV89920.1 50S ribosomal protein L9 [Bradymonas sediminis]TDP62142.1 LSU ribosomal protein L9P [Bradymonas sediminis]